MLRKILAVILICTCISSCRRAETVSDNEGENSPSSQYEKADFYVSTQGDNSNPGYF